MEKNSLQNCAIEHEAHDDEMEGIQKNNETIIC
jgi:hypothetical protein